jgi:hypothetical protein
MFRFTKIPFLLCVILTVPLSFVWGQARIESFSGLAWYKVFAGYNYNDMSRDMEQAPDGSIYYAGTYNDLLYIGIENQADSLFQDTLSNNPFYSHGYVVKLDSNGTFLWAWIIRGQVDSHSAVTDIVLDAQGSPWVTGWYQGAVSIPFGGNLTTAGTEGFLLHLGSRHGEGTHFSQISGDGVVPQKIFINPQGQTELVLEARAYPISIGNQALPISSTCDPFLTIATLDAAGTVVDHGYVGTSGTARGGYTQSTMDAAGNIYLLLWAHAANSLQLPGELVCAADTTSILGDHLVKLSPDFQMQWIQPTRPVVTNAVVELEASAQGEVYLAADSYNGGNAFVECHTASGKLIWEVSSAGYLVTTGDIALTHDYLYWGGYYQCDMSIDTVHFKIGEQSPIPWTARTGYLAVVNRHTGKVAWVMSDATTDQDKRFGKIVAQEDHHITVEARVTTTLCTVDTLTLQVTVLDVPYNIMLHFQGMQFPAWPTPEDTIPTPISGFQMWPNPTTGEFAIKMGTEWGPETQIEIYNMLGQRLMQQEIIDLQTSVSLDLVDSQMLLVRLYDKQSGRKLTKRLALQR